MKNLSKKLKTYGYEVIERNIKNLLYRTVGVANCLELRSVTCDNAQLPMLSDPCSCWPVAARVGSGH